MLWLALYFPDLPLEVFTRASPDVGVCAVSERRGGHEQVVRSSVAAQASGVRVGQSLPAALALAQGLRVYPRDREAEQALLEALANWAYQFSPQISFEPALLLLEVAGSLRLFGGFEPLIERVSTEAKALDMRLQWAAAPTPMAAGLLARSAHNAWVDEADLPRVLAPIALAALTRNTEMRRLITDIGLHSLGDCLQLPRAELSRRTGPALGLLLDRLLGEAADPRAPWVPAAVFSQRLSLQAEIEQQQALLFPAKRLLTSLSGFLRGQGAAAQQLHWRLWHREQRHTDFIQGLLQPSRDVEHIWHLLRERLTRVDLPEPVIALGLRVSDYLPYAERTGQWLSEAGLQRDNGLLEKLRSRLGEHQVTGLCCLPDYRPEQAWRYCLPGQPGQSDQSGQPSHLDVQEGDFAAAPPWLLREPQLLRTQHGQPWQDGPLQLSEVPQRVESGWWDAGDAARDYFVAHNQRGERLWVFCDRRSGQWFLQGLFG